MVVVEHTDGRSRRRERNAARLYDAAIELLATTRFDELTVEEICARADVGRATFFRIFETKAGLLREFNHRLVRDAAHRIGDSDERDLRTALGHVRDAIVDAWRDASPGLADMARDYARSAPSAHLHSPHPELLAIVHDLIADAIESGELPDTVPADLAASIALIQLSAPIAYVLAGHDADIETLCTVMLDQWYGGMTFTPPKRTRRPRAARR